MIKDRTSAVAAGSMRKVRLFTILMLTVAFMAGLPSQAEITKGSLLNGVISAASCEGNKATGQYYTGGTETGKLSDKYVNSASTTVFEVDYADSIMSESFNHRASTVVSRNNKKKFAKTDSANKSQKVARFIAQNTTSASSGRWAKCGQGPTGFAASFSPTRGTNSGYTVAEGSGANSVIYYVYDAVTGQVTPVSNDITLKKLTYGSGSSTTNYSVPAPYSPVSITVKGLSSSRLNVSLSLKSFSADEVYHGLHLGATGAAIYNDKSKPTILQTNSNHNITADFVYNYASSNGGAVANTPGSEIAEVGDITGNFLGNYTAGSGGAIYNNGTASYTATIDSVSGTFVGNNAASNGGAIYNNRGTITSVSADFIGNYSSNFGGAISNLSGSTINNISGDFIGNYSGDYGGAIHNSGTMTIGAAKFLSNTSTTGGAI